MPGVQYQGEGGTGRWRIFPSLYDRGAWDAVERERLHLKAQQNGTAKWIMS